jgi:ubiquinone/menaquinone biosynthesis C-methylase UbiE
MSTSLILILVIALLLLAGLYYFIDREIYFYEGTRLGPRVQRWLYDRWAAKYDHDKRASQEKDPEMLAGPVLENLAGIPEPLILDLAAGTGRLPLALCSRPGFQGHVFSMDISEKMLELASAKLAGHRRQVDLIQYLTLPLPFPDATFDAVCCLEALEVMPAMEPPLAELFRVLRPGGLLVTSRGTEASGREAKIRSAEDFTHLLQSIGFHQVQIRTWWKYFDQVMAHKPGQQSAAARAASLTDLLQCAQCATAHWKISSVAITCAICGRVHGYDANGILHFETGRS